MKFTFNDPKTGEKRVISTNDDVSKYNINDLRKLAIGKKIIDQVGSEKGKKEINDFYNKAINEYNKKVKYNKIKKFGGALAIGAGVGGAIGLAKAIHDKKKKDKENNKDIKENYEYDEYNTLIESIIYSLSNEELFMEDCNEFVHSVADYMIENS